MIAQCPKGKGKGKGLNELGGDGEGEAEGLNLGGAEEGETAEGDEDQAKKATAWDLKTQANWYGQNEASSQNSEPMHWRVGDMVPRDISTVQR